MDNQFNPPTGEPEHLAGQLEQAFEMIGASMMSNDFAAQLLAYLFVMGGGNEAVTHHAGLHAGIRIAQQKANLYGGCTPNADMLPLIQKYTRELQAAEASASKGVDFMYHVCKECPWLAEIFNRYGLTWNGKAPNSFSNNRK